jgi:NTP pyrophosphatase (non-canonical NTP hydrolase)
MKTFSNYQKFTRSTAQYPEVGNNVVYTILGLCGEVGEIAEKFKKLIRDHQNIMTYEYQNELKKELGDVIWYVSQLSFELGLSLDDVIQTNVEKLSSRKNRDVIKGDGDNR